MTHPRATIVGVILLKFSILNNNIQYTQANYHWKILNSFRIIREKDYPKHRPLSPLTANLSLTFKGDNLNQVKEFSCRAS